MNRRDKGRVASVHREDVKAALRKRFGSLKQFEQKRGLKYRSVTDVLRGKLSRRTAEAIARELGQSIHTVFPNRYAPANADCSNTHTDAHRQNGDAK